MEIESQTCFGDMESFTPFQAVKSIALAYLPNPCQVEVSYSRKSGVGRNKGQMTTARTTVFVSGSDFSLPKTENRWDSPYRGCSNGVCSRTGDIALRPRLFSTVVKGSGNWRPNPRWSQQTERWGEWAETGEGLFYPVAGTSFMSRVPSCPMVYKYLLEDSIIIWPCQIHLLAEYLGVQSTGDTSLQDEISRNEHLRTEGEYKGVYSHPDFPWRFPRWIAHLDLSGGKLTVAELTDTEMQSGDTITHLIRGTKNGHTSP